MSVVKKELSEKEIASIYLRREKKHAEFIKDANGKETEVPNKLAGQKYYILTFVDDTTKKEVVFTTDIKRFIKDYDKGQLAKVVLDIETTGTGASAVSNAGLAQHLSFDKMQALTINNMKSRRLTALEKETVGEKITTYSLKELSQFSI